MRFLVAQNRIRALLGVSQICFLAAFSSACSSDFSRFDQVVPGALPPGANYQTQQGMQAAYASNPYPGNVDTTTTASIARRLPNGSPRPYSNVAPPVAQVAYNQQMPSYGNVAGTRVPLGAYPNTYVPARTYQTGAVSSRNLPQVQQAAANPYTQRSGVYYQPNIDRTTTASVDKSAPTTPSLAERRRMTDQMRLAAAKTGGGWNQNGGTTVTLREGETIYNLSKRYGVPAAAIMRANGITDPSRVQVGQRILIPSYQYTQSAPISAPDNNKHTAAARSTRGVYEQAALSSGKVEEQNSFEQRRKRKNNASDPELEQSKPDYSITTASVRKPARSAGSYRVREGDTLYSISRRHGVSVDALMGANGMNSTNLRIGQVLTIPAGGRQLMVKNDNPGVDYTTTASVRPASKKPAPKPKPVISSKRTTTSSVKKPVQSSALATDAPARTGIDSLRWPVSGRVISNFGAKSGVSTNDGIDISVPEGTAVKAAENGVVIYSGSELESFGNLILVRHSDGFVTAYAHNRSNEVRKGEQVRRGQVIARSGKTGKASTPMLHFEVRKNSIPVDPLRYLGS